MVGERRMKRSLACAAVRANSTAKLAEVVITCTERRDTVPQVTTQRGICAKKGTVRMRLRNVTKANLRNPSQPLPPRTQPE